MPELTPEANRAARAILKWSVRELADQAGIAFTTVHRFESTGIASESTKDKIKAAYEAHGVEIINGQFTGARIRLPIELEVPLGGYSQNDAAMRFEELRKRSIITKWQWSDATASDADARVVMFWPASGFDEMLIKLSLTSPEKLL